MYIIHQENCKHTSTRRLAHKFHSNIIHLYEISQSGKSLESENRFVVVREHGERQKKEMERDQ
jgi:hypothetical protein